MQVDISDQLTELGHSVKLIGALGLRQLMYATRRATNAIRFTAGDDGKRLACTATVSDVGSAVAIARLLIHRQ